VDAGTGAAYDSPSLIIVIMGQSIHIGPPPSAQAGTRHTGQKLGSDSVFRERFPCDGVCSYQKTHRKIPQEAREKNQEVVTEPFRIPIH
jgi:hypothetical protein